MLCSNYYELWMQTFIIIIHVWKHLNLSHFKSIRTGRLSANPKQKRDSKIPNGSRKWVHSENKTTKQFSWLSVFYPSCWQWLVPELFIGLFIHWFIMTAIVWMFLFPPCGVSWHRCDDLAWKTRHIFRFLASSSLMSPHNINDVKPRGRKK